MSGGPLAWLRAQARRLVEDNAAGIAAERSGWDNYITDIYAALTPLHDQRRHDRRRQQWQQYERRGRH
jgi:hypothetical protein